MKTLNETIYGVITNAVGFSIARQERPDDIYEEDGNIVIDVSDEERERAEEVAKHVYVHLAEFGFLPYE
jgi:hypothetical protein